MSEIAEQIQNPVLPVPAVAEVPAPSLPEVPAQTPALELSQPENTSQDEVALTAEIAQLWQIHSDFKTSLRQQSQNLHSLRAELGKKLSAMKALLAKPGRNGQWSAWLKQNHISRATADRLVLRYDRSLHPESSCLTESITEPTEEEIKALLEKIVPKLRKALPTKTSAYKFIELLASSLVLESWETGEGFFLVKPATQNVGQQSVPERRSSRTNSVIANVLADGNCESTGTSMAL
jgi:hypothetical protein